MRLQGPNTDTLFRRTPEEDPVYPAYDSGVSEDGGVGNRIGLEKVLAAASVLRGGGAPPSRGVVRPQTRMRACACEGGVCYGNVCQ